MPKEKRVEDYWRVLNEVIDPELGIGIVDLGLIYGVEIKDSQATVTMTLTSMGCPVGPSLIENVRQMMIDYLGSEKVAINLVWTPAWTTDMVDRDVRAMI